MATTIQDFEVQTLTGISCVMNGVEYAKAVASVKFTPSTTINTWKGGTPDAVFTKATKPTYTCAMKIGQDYEDAASLANYLMQHAGETVDADFRFNSGKIISAALVIVPPEIGGDIDAMLDTTITHGVVGVPTIAAAPAA